MPRSFKPYQKKLRSDSFFKFYQPAIVLLFWGRPLHYSFQMMVMSYSQVWCLRRFHIQTTALLSSPSFKGSIRSPSLNWTPLITSASNLNPLNRRHLFWALWPSLYTMDKIVCLATHPLVFDVLKRTVANVDSIGFEVLICCQCIAGKSLRYSWFFSGRVVR